MRVTLREAARRLNVGHTSTVRGLLVGMGIHPVRVGKSLTISLVEMRRLSQKIAVYRERASH